jgi:hypothetical protein
MLAPGRWTQSLTLSQSEAQHLGHAIKIDQELRDDALWSEEWFT